MGGISGGLDCVCLECSGVLSGCGFEERGYDYGMDDEFCFLFSVLILGMVLESLAGFSRGPRYPIIFALLSLAVSVYGVHGAYLLR